MANSGDHKRPICTPYNMTAYNAGKMSNVFSQYNHRKKDGPKYVTWSNKTINDHNSILIINNC